MKVTGPQPRAWYDAERWSNIPFGWVAYTFSNRYYLAPWYFDLRVPQAGLGRPTDPADPAGYDPAKTIPTPWTNSDLEDVTGKNTLTPEDLTKPGGWRFKLEAGEKLYTSVELFNKPIFFATLKPGAVISGPGCSTSPSETRLYSMSYTTGGGATDAGAFTAAIPVPSSNRYNILSSGAPIKTVISTLSLGGGGILYTGTNEGAVRRGTSEPKANELYLHAPNNLRFTRYWRQN